MYETFKFDRLFKEQAHRERFNLSLMESNQLLNIFTEAYFIDGKETMKPVIEAFDNLKKLLELSIKGKSKFNANEFVKSLKFKELEDALRKVFGFRNIEIYCTDEGYDPKKQEFEYNDMNCWTYPTWRYPIKGLVTDKGFYDNSHSINTTVVITLGLLKTLTAEECVAVLLHEIGHNLDPAIVDIDYTVTNVYSKYLTDRDNKITDREKSIVKGKKLSFISVIIAVLGWVTMVSLINAIYNAIANLTFNREKAIAKIKNVLKHDGEFNRQNNQEAFADNLARMYGFGPALTSGSNKIDKFWAKRRESRLKKEKARERAIADIVQASIKDVHKTDIHRIRSMIREYEIDLKDPTIPDKVKKDIREDMEEVKKVLDSYLKDRSEFENRVNKLILDELEKADIKAEKKKKATEDKSVEKKLAELVKENADPHDMLETPIFED